MGVIGMLRLASDNTQSVAFCTSWSLGAGFEGGYVQLPCNPNVTCLMLQNHISVRVKINSGFLLSGSTWTGPAWSPAQCISSVLISIQSLMTENPYHNEPGFEQVRRASFGNFYLLLMGTILK